MPELPDIAVYIEALEKRIGGGTLTAVRLHSPFLLRTVDVSFEQVTGKKVVELRRIGKRIAIGLEGQYWLVFHLMIAGRFHWRDSGANTPGRNALVVLTFDTGILYLTEAGKKRRASLHVLQGDESLSQQDPGGMVVDNLDLEAFSELLTRSNHTLKRVLTDPRIFSGIGNAYSDEILHRGRLSPIKQSQKLSVDEIERLYHATKDVLRDWTDKRRDQWDGRFPEKVTALGPDMAVHGKYGQPGPVCRSKVQRIVYADNETNYLPAMSNRWETAGRPGIVTAAQEGLAQDDR